MYFDLDIRRSGTSDVATSLIVRRAKESGYDAVCVTTEAGCIPSEPAREVVMERDSRELNDSVNTLRVKGFLKKYVTRRLTIVAEKVTQIQRMSAANPVLRSYDLVSVVPMSQKVFKYCCVNAQSLDIIAIHSEQRLPFVFSKVEVDAAIARGIHFEVRYGDAIRDVTMRRYFISNLMALVRATRGRHIILSSGAGSASMIRSPFDALNLGVLCGMTFKQAKCAVTENCERALKHAAARRDIKGFVEVSAAHRDGSTDAASKLSPWAVGAMDCHSDGDEDEAGEFIRL